MSDSEDEGVDDKPRTLGVRIYLSSILVASEFWLNISFLPVCWHLNLESGALCVGCCRSTRVTEMRQERDMELVKLFSPTETVMRDSISTGIDMERSFAKYINYCNMHTATPIEYQFVELLV